MIAKTTIRAACLVLLLAAVPARAHEGLHEKIASVTRLIAEDPDNPHFYLRRGELYRLHRNWEAACRDLQRVEELAPESAEPNLVRGKLFFDQKRWEDALGSVDRFLQSEPKHGEAILLRAKVFVELGKDDAAAMEYSRAIANLNPPKPEHYLARAKLIAELGPEQTARALQGLDEGLKKLGEVPSLQLLAIELELSRDHFEAALERLGRIARNSPRQERWLARRGDVLLMAGRKEEALVAYRDSREAIQSLRPRHRKTAAVVELDSHVRARLRALGD